MPALVNLVVIDELSGDVNKLALGMKKTYFLGIRLTHGGTAGIRRGYFLLAAQAAGVSSGIRSIGRSANRGGAEPR